MAVWKERRIACCKSRKLPFFIGKVGKRPFRIGIELRDGSVLQKTAYAVAEVWCIAKAQYVLPVDTPKGSEAGSHLPVLGRVGKNIVLQEQRVEAYDLRLYCRLRLYAVVGLPVAPSP